MRRTQIAGLCIVAIVVCVSAMIEARSTDLTANVLSMIEQRVAAPNVHWSPDWQRDYLDTIRKVLRHNRDEPNYDKQLDILRRGFTPYWTRINHTDCTQAQFDVYNAEIRWFLETLMSEPLPSEADRDTLRAQYRMLYDYATEHLREQFPFLEEAHAQQAKELALPELDRALEAPLVPIFRKPFSQDQLDAIKANWARSHLRWFFIWRRVRYEAMDPKKLMNPPHVKFISQCLSHLPRVMWAALDHKPPGYVKETVEQLKRENAERTRLLVETRRTARRVALRFSNHLEQVEQWSFVFSALMETGVLQQEGDGAWRTLQKGGDADGLRTQQ